MTALDEAGFAELARKISEGSGFALDVYKDKCIRRRIAVRMRACGVHTYADYEALLDASPVEYERLRDALTINVTRFYRNAETWNLLRKELLPQLCSQHLNELRAWSAGCSSGEEAYTLAAVIAERLEQAGRPEQRPRVAIDATDVDRVSLERARAGRYRADTLTEMPPELVRAYLEPEGLEYRVAERVRRQVFVRHLDLSREPPPRADYHLIMCRNVVIYFDRPMQERLFQTFVGALAPGGLLILGKVETLFGPARDRLILVDPRERVWRRPG
ncbi:MAG: CheR family methyltransferase [Gemmatimonadales bacterium]